MMLCAALIKFDHFEWMIEKATELGVAVIVPVIAMRTEQGLEKAAPSASNDGAESGWRPASSPAARIYRRSRNLLRGGGSERCNGELLDTRWTKIPKPRRCWMHCLRARHPADEVALLIGPEGGWTDGERADFTAADWTPVSLGRSFFARRRPRWRRSRW